MDTCSAQSGDESFDNGGLIPFVGGMAAMSKIAQVQQERRKLEEDILALRSMLEAKEEKVRRLAITEQVLAEMSGDKTAANDDGEPATEKGPSWSKERTPKPEGTPPVPEMIIQVLKAHQGNKGLVPKEIAAEIAKRWWPDVTINAVGPIAWRMQKRGQLSKRGSRYSPSKEVESETIKTAREIKKALGDMFE